MVGSLALNISFMTYGLATMAYAILLAFLIRTDQYKGEHSWLLVAVITSILWGLLHSVSSVSGAYSTNLVFLFITYLLPFTDWLKGILWTIFLFNHLRVIWNLQIVCGNYQAMI